MAEGNFTLSTPTVYKPQIFDSKGPFSLLTLSRMDPIKLDTLSITAAH